jgi:hypothetical protein
VVVDTFSQELVKTVKYLLGVGSDRAPLTERTEMCPSRVNPKTVSTAR